VADKRSLALYQTRILAEVHDHIPRIQFHEGQKQGSIVIDRNVEIKRNWKDALSV
jgi:hypothetical protein